MSKGNGKPAVHADGFRFDMRVLGRGPGEFRDEKRTATAPEGLGSGLVLVAAGGDVALDLRFEAVSEGVLVTGSAVAPLTGECARCLDPLTTTVEVSFQELYRDSSTATSSTWSPRSVTRWCSRCRCRPCAVKTALGCAWNAASSWPRPGPTTGTATERTPGGVRSHRLISIKIRKS
jgi:hypothetical protein